MGYNANASAEILGLTEHEAAQLAQDASVRDIATAAPVAGSAEPNGTPIDVTLAASVVAPEAYRVLPEHILIGVVVLVSFVIPIFHMFG